MEGSAAARITVLGAGFAGMARAAEPAGSGSDVDV